MYNQYEKTYSDMVHIRMEELKRVRIIGFERTVNIISALILGGAVVYFAVHVVRWIVR